MGGVDQAGAHADPTSPTPARAVPARDRRRLLTVPFVFAVILLGAAAALERPFAAWMKVVRDKDPLPLKKPLAQMDRHALAPWRFVKAEVLPPEYVESLDTDQYMIWHLENRRRPADDPLRYASVFVTYYTGGPDLVPHTPDVCYVAGGYEPAQPHENVVRHIANLPPELAEVPLRILTFEKTSVFSSDQVSVVYTFFCNGRFTADRQMVRFWTNLPQSRYAFFSKVEISFGRAMGKAASRQQTLDGAVDVLSHLLPELLDHHWPDLSAAGPLPAPSP